MRRVTITCPITGVRKNVNEGTPPGVPYVEEDAETEGGQDLGLLTLTVVVPNPSRPLVQARRDMAMSELEMQSAMSVSSGQTTEDNAQLLREQYVAQLDQMIPLPPETIAVVWRWEDLSPEGVARIIEALRGAGVPFTSFEDAQRGATLEGASDVQASITAPSA